MKTAYLTFHVAPFDGVPHVAQVFAVDWCPTGEKVASGGKDRVLKLWMS